MVRRLDFRSGYRWVLGLAAAAGLLIYAACTTVSVPQPVGGPQVTGNKRPVISITDPAQNLLVAQSGTFTITWTDQDSDSAALISFALVNTSPDASPASVSLVQGIPENDTAAPDTITVATSFVPRGSYYLQGTITDGVNAPVTAFATTAPPASSRIVITVGESEATPSNRPPTIFVAQPKFNMSVTLDDSIVIIVQPTSAPPNQNIPYDADDNAQLYISLDLDDDPNTGDPLNPDPTEIIPLLDTPITIPMGDYLALDPIRIPVDLVRFPLREDGKPYYIRATMTDGNNPPRNAYAAGTINVTRFATGRVDLGKVGGTLTGATWLGFDPGARLGSAMAGVSNFDARPATDTDAGDFVDDCILVAQLGVPTGFKPVGEAYLIYGLDKLRFGGRINVNTVGINTADINSPGINTRGTEVDGATFIGPVARLSNETNGITSVGYIPDLTGDGRPELLFGCSYVDGIRQTRDDDPGDSSPGDRDTFEVQVQRGLLQVKDTRTDEIVLGPIFTYDSAIDTYLDKSNPDTGFGASAELFVNAIDVGGTVTPVQWALIEFDGLRSFISDFFPGRWNDDLVQGRIEDAVLELRAIDRGPVPALHALLRNFSESATYANWPQNGGDPEQDVDYETTAMNFTNDSIVTGSANTVNVKKTLEDLFSGARDIIGWIVVPATDRANDAVVFVSQDNDLNADWRPLLRITYSVLKPEGANLDGCYPDNLPNNTSNNPPVQGTEDDIIAGESNLERLGMVALVNSENRDAHGISDQNRLNRATVTLDLAGQRPVTDSGFAHGVPTMGAVGPSGRMEGARFQVALYDTIDAKHLNQGPIRSDFGARVGFLPDINNDQRPEVIISAPRNELDVEELTARFPGREFELTHLRSRQFQGNVIIYHGQNFNNLREKNPGSSSIPYVSPTPPTPTCNPPTPIGRGMEAAAYDWLVIFGEKPSDMLGDGSSAGDFNLDGSPDVLCGAPFADGPTGENAGTTYIVYQRQENRKVEIRLSDANFPSIRPPMLRIRGDKPDDRIGWAQRSVLDLNGDRIDDIVLASPYADAGGVPSDGCSRDFNGNGTEADGEDNAAFSACREQFGNADLSTDNPCAFFDYNNDRRIDELDAAVFASGPCPVDNGVIAVVFGGIMLDGDRVVAQIATPELPGVVFYGASAGDRAGYDIASAGDFNRDGYGDLLITAPGVKALDDNGRTRVGVVYLIFGGPHLGNRRFSLADVGSADLPGIVFLSPYVAGAPDEAPPQFVAGLGDINNDGFDDIGIGNPLADFVDTTFPQEPGSQGSDLSTGRRRDAGEVYMIYGNNITASNP
jgi:hypothetical protein